MGQALLFGKAYNSAQYLDGLMVWSGGKRSGLSGFQELGSRWTKRCWWQGSVCRTRLEDDAQHLEWCFLCRAKILDLWEGRWYGASGRGPVPRRFVDFVACVDLLRMIILCTQHVPISCSLIITWRCPAYLEGTDYDDKQAEQWNSVVWMVSPCWHEDPSSICPDEGGTPLSWQKCLRFTANIINTESDGWK